MWNSKDNNLFIVRAENGNCLTRFLFKVFFLEQNFFLFRQKLWTKVGTYLAAFTACNPVMIAACLVAANFTRYETLRWGGTIRICSRVMLFCKRKIKGGKWNIIFVCNVERRIIIILVVYFSHKNRGRTKIVVRFYIITEARCLLLFFNFISDIVLIYR